MIQIFSSAQVRFFFKSFPAVCLLLVSNANTLLFAQSTLPLADTLHGTSKEEVIVTGQFHPQSLKRSVYQVKVIGKERIQRQGATKLQDVLSNELNIRFSQDMAIGGSNISMMGLSGQNVKILLDGVALTGRQGTSNEIDLNQIDINTIERIEIVEGPMSVMYGADALAGVINIITKRPGTAIYQVQARVNEESVGKNYGMKDGLHNQTLSVGWRRKGWEIGAGGTHNNFYGWQGDTTGRVMTWKPKEQWLGNAQLRFTGSGWNIRYRLDAMQESIDNNGNFVGVSAYDQEYNSNRLMHQLQSDITLNKKMVMQAMASYAQFERETINTEVDANTGQEYYSSIPGDKTQFRDLTARTMMLYTWRPWMNVQGGLDVNYETGEGGRIAAGINEITDAGFFLAPEFKVKERWMIRPGIRAIYNSVYDAPPVVPSVNVKWGVSKNTDLRLSYARGFRAPSLRELYFYYFDANHQIEGNPNLKAELSHSFNGSFTVQCLQTDKLSWQTAISGFYNEIKNRIDYAQSSTNPQLTTYMNIDEYKSAGGTITNNMRWKNLQGSVGVGYTGRYNRFSKDDKSLPDFQWSPDVNASVSYAYKPWGVDAGLFYKFTGKLPQYQLHDLGGGQVDYVLTETEGYNWADITLGKKLFQYLYLQTGIRNLFDVVAVNNSAVSGGVHSSNRAKTVGYGRSYFLSLAVNFSK